MIKNSFNNFQQNDYDFAALEDEILANKPMSHSEDIQVTPKYKAYAYSQASKIPSVFYGMNQSEIFQKIQVFNNSAMNPILTCNVGTYSSEQNNYQDYHRFDVATGKDISPYYFKIPTLSADLFKNTTQQLKEMGAKFHPLKKEWYVIQEKQLDAEKILQNAKETYLQAKNQLTSGQDIIPEEKDLKNTISTDTYMISVSKNPEDNRCTLFFTDGKDPVTLIGDRYNLHFPSMNKEELEKFTLNYMNQLVPEVEKSRLVEGTPIHAWVSDYKEPGISLIEGKVMLQENPNELKIFSSKGTMEHIPSDSIFSVSQGNVLDRALTANLTQDQLNLMNDRSLAPAQMDAILTGFKEGLSFDQVKIYSFNFYAAWQMDLMRIGQQHGVSLNNLKELVSKDIGNNSLLYGARREELNSLINDKRTQIATNIKIAGFEPSPKIVKQIEELNHITKKENSLSDIAKNYTDLGNISNEKEKNLIIELGKTFAHQEALYKALER